MFRVFIDEDTDEESGKPHYIMVELSTGKCMYISPDQPVENELKSWNSTDVSLTSPSIYQLHRELKREGLPIIYGAALGTFDTIEEVHRIVSVQDLLE